MAASRQRTKFGVVIILDALGASTFSAQQIKQFLSARSIVNDIVTAVAKNSQREHKFHLPEIFTFGDTLVITLAIKKNRSISSQIAFTITLMRRYIFHAMVHGLLFRGAFAIGNYISDSASNTVMGEAVADAAAWYEQADWAGVCATPRSCTQIDYYYALSAKLMRPAFLVNYDVPLKGGTRQKLYCVSWPGAFFDEQLRKLSKEQTPRLAFLAILKDMNYPASAASKYENTKRFFLNVEENIASTESGSLVKADS